MKPGDLVQVTVRSRVWFRYIFMNEDGCNDNMNNVSPNTTFLLLGLDEWKSSTALRPELVAKVLIDNRILFIKKQQLRMAR